MNSIGRQLQYGLRYAPTLSAKLTQKLCQSVFTHPLLGDGDHRGVEPFLWVEHGDSVQIQKDEHRDQIGTLVAV
jgi:hypothetical protein